MNRNVRIWKRMASGLPRLYLDLGLLRILIHLLHLCPLKHIYHSNQLLLGHIYSLSLSLRSDYTVFCEQIKVVLYNTSNTSLELKKRRIQPCDNYG